MRPNGTPLLAAAFAAAFSILPSTARAALPSPSTSSLPSCIKATMDASALTFIVVRDFANNPVSGSFVVLDYSDCADFKPCPPGGVADDYTLDLPTRTLRAVTNAAGQVFLHVRAGGGCALSPLRIFADGVFLGARRASSTDQNGDHVVDNTDVTLLHAKVGTTDLTGDLDGDGIVDAYDESILFDALGTTCLDPTPTRPTTWGRVKTLYR